jgi:hypothetical protein
MANQQITLGVFRDANAPYNPAASKTGYYHPGSTTVPAPKGRSFHVDCIRGIKNVTEDGNTYGQFIYQLNENSVPETVWSIHASGLIILSCNT